MKNEQKLLLIATILDIAWLILNFIMALNYANILSLISTVLSIVLAILLIILIYKYRKAVDSYEFIKYLFFGSRDNGFNFFPKLKLFMDYLGYNNQLEVGKIRFEYVVDLEKEYSDVTWTMENVRNNTKQDIASYYLYTSNEYGEMKEGQMEVTKGGYIPLCINASLIESKNGIQMTPYTFTAPIKPNCEITKLKIAMKMRTKFDISRPRVVFLYPRNYGNEVKSMEIKYKIKGVSNVDISLHEVGKNRSQYRDVEKMKGVITQDNDILECVFHLNGEISIDSLYYLLINAN